MVFLTATSTALGQGKSQAGPAVAAIYTGVRNLTLGVVAQNPISYVGSANRPAVKSLSLTPTVTYDLPHGWFAGSDDFEITFDWEKASAPLFPLVPKWGRFSKPAACLSASCSKALGLPCGRPAAPSGWMVPNSLSFLGPSEPRTEPNPPARSHAT